MKISNNKVLELVFKIKKSQNYCGKSKIVSIDGPSGSGKTTLATKLKQNLDNCEVVHMDQIYSGWGVSFNENLFDDIFNWIIKPIQSNNPIVYKPFNWNENKRSGKINIENYKNIIIEGVGSCNSFTEAYSCLKIWVEGDSKQTLKRVLNRDGYKIEKEMKRWQEKEKIYFDQHKVKQRADILFFT